MGTYDSMYNEVQNKQHDADYNKGFDTATKVGAGITIASAIIGLFGETVSSKNRNEADKLISEAKKSYNEALSELEQCNDNAKNTILEVVSLKKEIMTDDIKVFLKSYKRLSPKIKLRYSSGLEELEKFVLNQRELEEIECSVYTYSTFSNNRTSEDFYNLAVTMVTDGSMSNFTKAVGNVVNVSIMNDNELKRIKIDELKIESVNVLAQFSTASFMFGLSSLDKAITSKSDLLKIKDNIAKLEKQKELIAIDCIKVKSIDRYANIHLQLLKRFIPLIKKYVAQSTNIIKSKDNIFHFGRIKEDKFTEKELEILAFTFSLMGAVKAIIDSPILAQNGEVYEGEDLEFLSASDNINKFEKIGIEMLT